LEHYRHIIRPSVRDRDVGVPIAVSVGITALVFLWGYNLGIQVMSTNFFANIAKFPLLAIPFFILAGFGFYGCGNSWFRKTIWSNKNCSLPSESESELVVSFNLAIATISPQDADSTVLCSFPS
jgi:hypothetical protein